MRKRQATELVREGRYVAEVAVELLEEDHEWAPYLSLSDSKMLDEVRLALRSGDLKRAAQFGKVFELTPVAAE